MEHEVFVPVPAESLRAVLCDSQRVDRALPGYQGDVSGGGGRLKVRIGGHTITYRGSVTVAQSADGSFAMTGEGSEARGTGGVKFALTARVAAAAGGSAVTFTGTGSGDGRVAELPREAVAAAAHRLLNRFAENLGATGQEPGSDPDEDMGEYADADTDADTVDDLVEGMGDGPVEVTREDVEGLGDGPVERTRPDLDGGPAADTREDTGDGTRQDTGEGPREDTAVDPVDHPVDDPTRHTTDDTGDDPTNHTVEGSGRSSVGHPADPADSLAREDPGESREAFTSGEDHSSVFDSEIPPPSLDPDADLAGAEGAETELPAEPVAAHARRTMIGRSAEEVDHAPPRGRYAPVPAPEGVTTSATLRWAAPAAAVALASAIVVGRALRRRR
ncbi:SRPBCC family protein [Streptomyces fractus]|uniref:SRPBCC family protein n=1 Tax=Streptomyces fractus TaxID=641806 RepID=UPI003CEC0F3A